jgi:predicted Rossmann-fold nucleotide-binding protein
MSVSLKLASAVITGLVTVVVRWRSGASHDDSAVPQERNESKDDLQYVAVFCGSKHGKHSEYAEAARALGKEIVRRGYGLVYGGGSVGLMGEVARGVDEAGGKVIGVIPRALMPREFTGKLIQVENVIVTQTMHGECNFEVDAFVCL